MNPLYPFRFRPLFRNYIWGGRRLATILGKDLPDDSNYAESWEIVDHGDDQSHVSAGAYEGWTLQQLVQQRGESLLGKHHPQQQFPLLFKFLDCQRNLSVQVHPNDAQGAELDPPDLGKTEAWVIVGAEPGSCLYAGLKRGFDRDAFERELTRGTAELCLHKVQPQVGDCIFIPAGTVHALGQGLLVAEIQQSSNTTFRLFDWNRVGADGKPRELHLERGLAVTDFERGPVQPQIPESTEQVHVRRIVECDKFVMDRLTIDQSRPIGGDGGCHILAVVDGSANVEGDVSGQPLAFGQTMLVPASCGEIVLSPTDASAVILDMYLP